MPEPIRFNDFLSEKQIIDDFLSVLESELEACLDDFEILELEKLVFMKDQIQDHLEMSKIISAKFYKDFEKLNSDFKLFIERYEDLPKNLFEKSLEDFSDWVLKLKQDLYSEDFE